MRRRFKFLVPLLLTGLLLGCTASPLPVTVVPTATPTDVTLVKGPYVQSVTPTSIVVAWETDRPTLGSVTFGQTEACDRLHEDPQVRARHAVTLTGLSPYTRYHYQVQVGPTPLGETYTFRTAADADQTRFSFVAFGDTRTQMRFHRAVVERILTLDPDFVLHTGDLVEHGYSSAEWQDFFDTERELMAHAPLFPTMGNHEGNLSVYRDLFYLPGNERWYSFDYGHAHFICLQVDNIADLTPEGEQIRWLQSDLASTDQPWRIVFFHVPPYSCLGENQDEVRTRQALASLLTEHGVQLVINGHHHNYQRLSVAGVTYVVTGGGGAPLYSLTETAPELRAAAVEYHAVLLTFDGPTLTAEAVSTGGEELDRFTIELH